MQQAPQGFTTPGGHASTRPGSFVVPLAQPKMGLIRYLLGRTFYPDNEWTRDRDGSPIRPYDMATDTMFEFMGVRVDPVDDGVRRRPAETRGRRCCRRQGRQPGAGGLSCSTAG